MVHNLIFLHPLKFDLYKIYCPPSLPHFLSPSPSLFPLLSLPSPPRWCDHPEGLPSVERAPPNGFPSAIAAQLSQIPESPNTTVSSDLSLSQFQARIEQLKTQVQQKHQNGGNAPSPPSGANGSDCNASGRFN